MSTLLAVDVVLLPPPETMEQVIRLIDYDEDSVIKLDLESCLPHISLAMGVMKETDIAKVHQVLEQVAANFRPFDLQISRTPTQRIPNGKIIAGAEVDYDVQLTRLHLGIMSSLSPFLTHDNVQTNMFSSPPTVAEISTTWVQHYFDDQTPEGFRPHITLGEGTVRQPDQPIKFTANRLALCHLGNYCTCRKVLSEITIQ